MNDFIKAQFAAAANAIDSIAGETVVYKRTGQDDETITGTFGKSIHSETKSQGVSVRFATIDFLINTSSFPYEEPNTFDVIERTDGEETILYRVVRPEGEKEHFRYCDSQRVRMRIHLIETA